jgi:hypothetical protein
MDKPKLHKIVDDLRKEYPDSSKSTYTSSYVPPSYPLPDIHTGKANDRSRVTEGIVWAVGISMVIGGCSMLSDYQAKEDAKKKAYAERVEERDSHLRHLKRVYARERAEKFDRNWNAAKKELRELPGKKWQEVKDDFYNHNKKGIEDIKRWWNRRR